VELKRLLDIFFRAQTAISRVVRGRRGRRVASERRKLVSHREEVRYKSEKKSVDAAVKLAMSRAQFYLESEEGKRFVQHEKGNIKKLKNGKKEFMEELDKEEREKLLVLEVFDTFDLDNSGFIDSNELNELLIEVGVKLSEDKLDEAIKVMDDDESGEIGFEEFHAWFKAHRESKKSWLPTVSLSAIVNAGMSRRAKTNVCLHFTRLAAREAIGYFRTTQPPNFYCNCCRQPFALFGDYRRHFERKGGDKKNLYCKNVVIKKEEIEEEGSNEHPTRELKKR
jgi:hypothetical protein